MSARLYLIQYKTSEGYYLRFCLSSFSSKHKKKEKIILGIYIDKLKLYLKKCDRNPIRFRGWVKTTKLTVAITYIFCYNLSIHEH